MSERLAVYDKDRHLTGVAFQRGQAIQEDMYLLAVQAWIRNSRGEWFLTKRAANKSHPLKWEAPGGMVQSGETGKQAIEREVQEETGIILPNGMLFRTFHREKTTCENPGFLDVWVFQADFPLSHVRLQPEEACYCKWAT